MFDFFVALSLGIYIRRIVLKIWTARERVELQESEK